MKFTDSNIKLTGQGHWRVRGQGRQSIRSNLIVLMSLKSFVFC